MRQFLRIVLIVMILASCKGREGYVIEGKITGLQNPSLYFVIPDTNSQGVRVDTVLVKPGGRFRYEGNSQQLTPVILYMEDGNVWTTVWARDKDQLSVSGHVNFPEMIIAKGGEVNDLLAGFKTENKSLLQERRNLMDHHHSDVEMNDSLGTKMNYPEYESKLLNVDHQLKEKAEKFINNHFSSIASLVLIQDYLMDGSDPELVRTYLSKMEGDVIRDTLYRKLVRVNDKYCRTLPGSKAPDFTVLDINNDTIRLNSYRGKYFLLTFAASWCETCDKDNEDLVLLYKDSDRKQLEVLTISLDGDSTAWSHVIKEKKMVWHQVIDTDGWGSDIVSLYNITEIPSNVLINKESIIVGRNLPTDSIKKVIRFR
ncbi:MAG: AhpC/TSA family protein [Dysgonamonadaceae bacterium]|jgi:peroxiredoxin|nr:AhpC/TSA family protein [Dysgonamonadaceae bacterium]